MSCSHKIALSLSLSHDPSSGEAVIRLWLVIEIREEEILSLTISEHTSLTTLGNRGAYLEVTIVEGLW